MLTFSQVSFWFSLVPLLILGGPQLASVAAGAFLLRMVALTMVFDRIHKRLDATFEWYCIPLLDFLYIFYYLFMGISTLFTKKVQWN